MMYSAGSGIDFGLVAIYLFWGFFASLILYLRREDRREGYPLEQDGTRRLDPAGGLLFTALPKTFHLPFGRAPVTVPNNRRDDRVLAAKRTAVVPGSPIVPTGNPLIDGIGPASYCDRAKVPDLTAHGEVRIKPLRHLKDFSIAPNDKDPRGYRVIGTDGASAGSIKDLWVDRGEVMVRYLEVALTGGASVLLPITMAVIDNRNECVKVDAITAAQFADVPKLASDEQITLYEEERVCAYYGGGFLYATPSRLEPLL